MEPILHDPWLEPWINPSADEERRMRQQQAKTYIPSGYMDARLKADQVGTAKEIRDLKADVSRLFGYVPVDGPGHDLMGLLAQKGLRLR